MSDPAHKDSFLSVIRSACQEHSTGPVSWSIGPSIGSERDTWLVVRNSVYELPEQGWKLHVSASVVTASDILRRALPVLIRNFAAFKVAASPDCLGKLNEGRRGLTQIGKFITVYPASDDHAVRVAAALDAATAGLRGPRVPSDRPLRPGGVVHYRYGGFGALSLQRPNGELARAVRSPRGELVPDLRGLSFIAPEWVVDPFLAAGVSEDLPAAALVVAGRYLLTRVLGRSARGAVYHAVDLDLGRPCVVKQANAGSLMHVGGSDARSLVQHECDVLRALGPDRRFPSVLDLVEDGYDLYLVMSDLRANTLESYVRTLARKGCTVPVSEIARWGRALTAMLNKVHVAGYVYRDLKSTNVLVDSAGDLFLVDFEYACRPDSPSVLWRAGTRGYVPPQQANRQAPAVSDDIYGLGALLLYMATGAEPSQMPDPERPLARALNLLNPGITPRTAAVIKRCLDPDPASRFQTLAEVDAGLASFERDVVNGPSYGRELPRPLTGEPEVRTRWRTLARRVGDTLCAVGEHEANSGTTHWICNHPLNAGIPGRDVNTGTAGTVLALAELVADLADPTHRDALAAGIRWLVESSPAEGDPLPGLYVGEAGVAAALLRGGQVLGDRRLVELAETRGRWIASLPHSSPDLFSGTAGRLRFHLLLWDETGAEEHLLSAAEAAERLVGEAVERESGALCWPIPEGYGGLSGKSYLGYAHGAAGIADSLLDLYDATGELQCLEAARGAARWLSSLAVPALDDGSGLSWPSCEGEDPAAAYWCHGAAGIGSFWLHAARIALVPEARECALRAAMTTARGSRWAGAPLCHGLAGSIELLLDAYQASGDERHLVEARSLGYLLEASAIELEGGLAAWYSESPDVMSPDYNVGYAGVACTLLRLAAPATRPHALSRRSFRFRGSRQPTRRGLWRGSELEPAASLAPSSKEGVV